MVIVGKDKLYYQTLENHYRCGKQISIITTKRKKTKKRTNFTIKYFHKISNNKNEKHSNL